MPRSSAAGFFTFNRYDIRVLWVDEGGPITSAAKSKGICLDS
jgi:hypothetical protein